MLNLVWFFEGFIVKSFDIDWGGVFVGKLVFKVGVLGFINCILVNYF